MFRLRRSCVDATDSPNIASQSIFFDFCVMGGAENLTPAWRNGEQSSGLRRETPMVGGEDWKNNVRSTKAQ